MWAERQQVTEARAAGGPGGSARGMAAEGRPRAGAYADRAHPGCLRALASPEGASGPGARGWVLFGGELDDSTDNVADNSAAASEREAPMLCARASSERGELCQRAYVCVYAPNGAPANHQPPGSSCRGARR